MASSNRPNNNQHLSNLMIKTNASYSVVIEQNHADISPLHHSSVAIDSSLAGSRFAYGHAPRQNEKSASTPVNPLALLAGSRFKLLETSSATPKAPRISNSPSGLFTLSNPGISLRPHDARDKMGFLMKHFPSLFIQGELIKNPVIIIKRHHTNQETSYKLRHCPSPGGISHFEAAGYTVIKHVGLKKCIDKLLELPLEALHDALKLKEELNAILEDAISELQPFAASDDLVLTASGHTYLKKDLDAFLSTRSKKNQPEIDPISMQPLLIKPIQDNAVKVFLKELDTLTETDDCKATHSSSAGLTR